jgi:hypothetical protein
VKDEGGRMKGEGLYAILFSFRLHPSAFILFFLTARAT